MESVIVPYGAIIVLYDDVILMMKMNFSSYVCLYSKYDIMVEKKKAAVNLLEFSSLSFHFFNRRN